MSQTISPVATPGDTLDVWRAGSGPAVVVVHRDIGRGSWNEFYSRLAERHTVLVPALPGFESTTRPTWMRSVSDLARLFQRQLDTLGLQQPTLVGLGFGGWVAAELVSMRPDGYRGLVLHAPVGIKPRSGEILDQFLFFAHEYVRLGFSSDAVFESRMSAHVEEEARRWDGNREVTTQVTWKPYMYSFALPHLLEGMMTPTRVMLSGNDRIVPDDCGIQYAELLGNASLETIDSIGHIAEAEDPRRFAGAVLASLDALERTQSVSDVLH